MEKFDYKPSVESKTTTVAYELYDEETEENFEPIYEASHGDTVEHRHQHRANSFERFIYFIARAFVWAICLTTILFVFVFKVMLVSGNSMNPAVSEDDYIVVNRLDKSPAFGDIVVISNDSDNKRPTVKRVVATEDQAVRVDCESDAVYVNGKKVLSDIYKDIDIKPLGSVTYPVKVPKGCYFVLGDNLSNSLDSRSTTVGMVPKEKIIGTVIMSYRKNEGIRSLEDTPIDTPVEEKASELWDEIKDLFNRLTKGIK